MAGLRPDCDGFSPWGYQQKSVASKAAAPVSAPNEYNKGAIPGAPSSRLYVPVPVSAPLNPPRRAQDKAGNVTASSSPFVPLDPHSFNKNAIGTNYNMKYPELVPWSREAAKAQVSGSGGGIEPNKDLKSVAETFAKTSTDPAQKDRWERFVNSLSQLEAIEITRGLNAEENKIKDDIMKEISNASNDLSTLAINAPPYAPPLAKPPKPAPATAADIAALLAQFQQGQAPQPPGPPPGPPQQQPQQQQQGGIVTNPVGFGPPQNGIYEYTFIPADEWKTKAAPGTAFYIGIPQNDTTVMSKNLRLKYPTGYMPPAEMKTWKSVIIAFNPNKKPKQLTRGVGENDVAYTMRYIKRGCSRIMDAYLADPTYFAAFTNDTLASIPKLATDSLNNKFPYHHGMELKPPNP